MDAVEAKQGDDVSGSGAGEDVSAWLAALSLSLGIEIEGWVLQGARRGHDAQILTFAKENDRVDVSFMATLPGRKRFASTKSFDLSHGQVRDEIKPLVGEFMRHLVVLLQNADLGGLSLPVDDGGAAAVSTPSQEALGDVVDYGGGGSGIEPALDPSKETSEDAPVIKFHYIDVSELDRFPDAIRQMYEGKLGGLVIRNVFEPAMMQQIVKRLEGNAQAFPKLSFPERFKAHFFGRCLDGNDPELRAYLKDAELFREQSRAVFSGTHDFEARMNEMFSRMGNGRGVEVPKFKDGRSYTPATIRILPVGGQIGTHCGNEASTRTAYDHLNTLIDRHDQISYFLTLQAPTAGGELIVYDLQWAERNESWMVNGRSNVDALVEKSRWMAVRPQAGDLLLFDGGRYFHRVAVVKGERTRWTMGGFLMFSKDGGTIHYWS